MRPDWHLVLVGPVVKIDRAHLPQLPNIHYLGPKAYEDLPRYMAGWDVGMLPFALNESTRFISPTKTPEYLAAGLPVVSTPIRDVVAPYGLAELALIGMTGEDFVNAVESLLARSSGEQGRWLKRVDGFLSTMSWDRTFERMSALITDAVANRDEARAAQTAHAHTRRTPAAAHFDVALEA
jgi:UDP-galactopyranose mutase